MDKIQELYTSYDDIVNKVTLQRVQERFRDLNQSYIDFIESENISDKVKVNSFMLIHAILDYFTDISRL